MFRWLEFFRRGIRALNIASISAGDFGARLMVEGWVVPLLGDGIGFLGPNRGGMEARFVVPLSARKGSSRGAVEMIEILPLLSCLGGSV